MRWLRKLLSPEGPPPSPVLLRVVDPRGGAPAAVAVEAVWQPSGRVVARTHRTADGLCVVPWLGDEHEVRLEIRSGEERSALSVTRDRPDGGRVRDIRLEPAAPSPSARAR